MLTLMNAKQNRGKLNAIEQLAYLTLDDLGIHYVKQHLLEGKFCVDAFLPSLNIVLQVDGDYWHANPTRYAVPDERQRRRVTLDRSQDAYMASRGYHVVRVWESDLRRNANCIEEALSLQCDHAMVSKRLRASAMRSEANEK